MVERPAGRSMLVRYMARVFLQPRGPRPDFRLVISFLWGDLHNVDTEGNSYNPANRDWTELYCQNRENELETFHVGAVSQAPLTLAVESDLPELAARVAYFLATETWAAVASDPSGPWHGPALLRKSLGSFDLAAAELRAQKSVWREATLEDPYPNLRGGQRAI
jgi:hypothetical protein